MTTGSFDFYSFVRKAVGDFRIRREFFYFRPFRLDYFSSGSNNSDTWLMTSGSSVTKLDVV